MTVELNHVIVHAEDAHVSATFLAHILGIEVGPQWGPFVPISVANRVTLQFMSADHVRAQHCAFLMSDAEFATAMDRVRAAGLTYWADPFQERENEIDDGPDGRRLYFMDPSGHLMEILTAPTG